jgi:hypothetical protein
MYPIQFNFPTGPERHARPGVDVPVSTLQHLIKRGEVGSFIACQHPGSPYPDYWFLYAMGNPPQKAPLLGIVTSWADRPLALATINDVAEMLGDVGWNGALQVCPEPIPVEA